MDRPGHALAKAERAGEYGAVLFGDVHHTIGNLLRQADMAMYEAKAGGRATFRFFDPACRRRSMLPPTSMPTSATPW